MTSTHKPTNPAPSGWRILVAETSKRGHGCGWDHPCPRVKRGSWEQRKVGEVSLISLGGSKDSNEHPFMSSVFLSSASLASQKQGPCLAYRSPTLGWNCSIVDTQVSAKPACECMDEWGMNEWGMNECRDTEEFVWNPNILTSGSVPQSLFEIPWEISESQCLAHTLEV